MDYPLQGLCADSEVHLPGLAVKFLNERLSHLFEARDPHLDRGPNPDHLCYLSLNLTAIISTEEKKRFADLLSFWGQLGVFWFLKVIRLVLLEDLDLGLELTYEVFDTCLYKLVFAFS